MFYHCTRQPLEQILRCVTGWCKQPFGINVQISILSVVYKTTTLFLAINAKKIPVFNYLELGFAANIHKNDILYSVIFIKVNNVRKIIFVDINLTFLTHRILQLYRNFIIQNKIWLITNSRWCAVFITIFQNKFYLISTNN